MASVPNDVFSYVSFNFNYSKSQNLVHLNKTYYSVNPTKDGMKALVTVRCLIFCRKHELDPSPSFWAFWVVFAVFSSCF